MHTYSLTFTPTPSLVHIMASDCRVGRFVTLRSHVAVAQGQSTPSCDFMCACGCRLRVCALFRACVRRPVSSTCDVVCRRWIPCLHFLHNRAQDLLPSYPPPLLRHHPVRLLWSSPYPLPYPLPCPLPYPRRHLRPPKAPPPCLCQHRNARLSCPATAPAAPAAPAATVVMLLWEDMHPHCHRPLWRYVRWASRR
jgi:hypothetical protein